VTTTGAEIAGTWRVVLNSADRESLAEQIDVALRDAEERAERAEAEVRRREALDEEIVEDREKLARALSDAGDALAARNRAAATVTRLREALKELLERYHGVVHGGNDRSMECQTVICLEMNRVASLASEAKG
jgi:hypothetical protein